MGRNETLCTFTKFGFKLHSNFFVYLSAFECSKLCFLSHVYHRAFWELLKLI